MDTIATPGNKEGGTSGPELAPPDPTRPPRPAKEYALRILAALVVAGLIAWSFFEDKIQSTLITVIVAVVASAGLWIAANLLFNQVRERWRFFNAVAWGVVGSTLGIVLHGNMVTLGSGRGFLVWIVGPLVGFAVVGGLGFALSGIDDLSRRRVVSLAGATAIGVGIGLSIRSEYHPGLDPLAIVGYTAAVAGIGAGINALRSRPPVTGALTGAAIGAVLGFWGGADLGDGSIVTSVIACVAPGVLVGLRLGVTSNPDHRARTALDTRSRAIIFVGPAIAFVLAMLVIPTIRTLYLSLFGPDSEEWLGIDNYTEIFTDRNSFDASNWTNMFTSVPFLLGVTLLAIAVGTGLVMRQRTGRAVELGNPTSFPLVVGVLLVSFGVFTAFRGTLINNLWWVVTVTFVSTAMGLAVAVLADNKGGERVAKSLIFMPMAISLVGASIIWRFMYAARDTSQEQTGVMNALWIGLGRLSTGSGIPTLVATAALGLALIGLFAVLATRLVKREYGRIVLPGILILLAGWLFIRFTGLIGGGVGGFTVDGDGKVSGDTILFVQETPYNSFWLMVIFIWIQTGFAMVILSAAIKAVPTELIEAARIDGATDSQVFWRITLPQIATTIGVVVTTLIVGVMKVYDIVKVVTNGQFGTQVLANNMFQEAFTNSNKGRGAALAMLIFLSVLPVMVYNIRRMQREN